MTALIGYDLVGPHELKRGEEVCFTRNIWVRDDAAADILAWAHADRIGAGILLVVYGEVVKDPRCIAPEARPSEWEVWVYLSSVVIVHAGGTTQTIDLDAKEALESVAFVFKFDEQLMRVRHDGTPV